MSYQLPVEVFQYIQEFAPKDNHYSSPSVHPIHQYFYDVFNAWNVNDLTDDDLIVWDINEQLTDEGFIEYKFKTFHEHYFFRRRIINGMN